MPTLLPGIKLNRRYSAEAGRPSLTKPHPGLRYATALRNPGRAVLGFDVVLSMDPYRGFA